MKGRIEGEEIGKTRGQDAGVAAFFDLDGTMLVLPSLERRFFWMLRYRGAISVRNYLWWLKEAVRLVPRGIASMLQANKMYLRGIAPVRWGSGVLKPTPTFFEGGLERVLWHASKGHHIVLMSGTLEPLAMASARALVSELAARGIFLAIRVCATRLEVVDGQWTGRILGEAMFGKAKARMAKKIAVELKLDLAHCYAYCDRSDDRWLLATVGRPVAVNATDELARLAGMHGWPVLNWKREANLTPRPGAQGALAEKKDLSLVIA